MERYPPGFHEAIVEDDEEEEYGADYEEGEDCQDEDYMDQDEDYADQEEDCMQQDQDYPDQDMYDVEDYDAEDYDAEDYAAEDYDAKDYDVSTPEIDAFDIPEDLCIMIASHLDTLDDADNVCLASPCMFRAIRASESYFLRNFLPHMLPPSCFQSLLAIMTFPDAHTGNLRLAGYYHCPPFLATRYTIIEHLDRWRRGKFPRDLKGQSPEVVLQMGRLVRVVHHYADDYLAKATCRNPTAAYYRLPQWTHKSHIPKPHDLFYMYNPGSDPDGSVSSEDGNGGRSVLGQLRPDERERVLDAFLRYELYCMVSRPRRPSELDLTLNAFLAHTGRAPEVPLRDASFHRKCVRWIAGDTTAMEQGGERPRAGQDLTPSTAERRMASVVQYVHTLHGAVFFQRTRGALCVDGASRRTRRDDGPPRADEPWFDPHLFYHDPFRGRTSPRPALGDWLCTLGLGALTRLLRARRADYDLAVRELVMAARRGIPATPHEKHGATPNAAVDVLRLNDHRFPAVDPAVRPRRFWRVPGCGPPVYGPRALVFECQRALPFFDDETPDGDSQPVPPGVQTSRAQMTELAQRRGQPGKPAERPPAYYRIMTSSVHNEWLESEERYQRPIKRYWLKGPKSRTPDVQEFECLVPYLARAWDV